MDGRVWTYTCTPGERERIESHTNPGPHRFVTDGYNKDKTKKNPRQYLKRQPDSYRP